MKSAVTTESLPQLQDFPVGRAYTVNRTGLFRKLQPSVGRAYSENYTVRKTGFILKITPSVGRAFHTVSRTGFYLKIES